MRRGFFLFAGLLVAGLAVGSFATSGTFGSPVGSLPLATILSFACQLTGGTNCEMSGSVKMNGNDITLDADDNSKFELSDDNEIGLYLNNASLTTFHTGGQNWITGAKIAWPATGESITDTNGITINTDDGSLSVCSGSCPSFTHSSGMNVEGGIEVDTFSYFDSGMQVITEGSPFLIYNPNYNMASAIGCNASGFNIGSSLQNTLFVPYGHWSDSWSKSASTDPKVYVCSATDPASATDQCMWQTHNQTNAVIGTDKGDVLLDPFSGIAVVDSQVSATTLHFKTQTLPACNAANRGHMVLVAGAGVADVVYVCLINTSHSAYSWVQIASGL